VRRTIGNPVQRVIGESMAFSLDGELVGVSARLFLEAIRYRLLRVFFPKLHEPIRWAHTQVVTWLTYGLIYSNLRVVFLNSLAVT
jgi:hypothetical protein